MIWDSAKTPDDVPADCHLLRVSDISDACTFLEEDVVEVEEEEEEEREATARREETRVSAANIRVSRTVNTGRRTSDCMT